MRRAFLFGLVAALVVVAAVGVALATTRGSTAVGSGQVAAPASGADSGAATPATFTEGGNADSWDDCGDPGESSRGAGTGAGHSSNGKVDDDGDGDGGDCGEGD
jgi:hypothetical protein